MSIVRIRDANWLLIIKGINKIKGIIKLIKNLKEVKKASIMGLEPITLRLEVWCATIAPYGHSVMRKIIN